MIARSVPAAVVVLTLALAPASAGASDGRPPVALSASPAHVSFLGAGRAIVRVTNSGANRVVVDVRRAGFALDLRGRPRIVRVRGAARSAARWLSFHPSALILRPGGSAFVTIVSALPPGAEPGDHDALVLITTRRRVRDGLAVRMRMGIVVVVRAPGAVVRRLALRGLRAVRNGRARALELVVANRGNVTESFDRSRATLFLSRRGQRIGRLTVEPRDLRPRTSGILQFRYRRALRGWARARVEVASDPGGRVIRRTFRVRL